MIATYQRTIFESKDFSICSFKPEAEDDFPPGAIDKKFGTFVGTGFNLPHSEEVQVDLDGEWQSTKYGLQLKIECDAFLTEKVRH